MTAASPKGVPRSVSPTRIPEDPDILGHHLAFSVVRHRVEIADEILRKEPSSEADGYLLYRTPDGTLMRRMLMSAHSWIPGGDVPEAGDIPPLSSDQSILSQYRAYITLGIGGVYSGIQTFREWTFGRYTHLRQPQPGRDRRLREAATQHDASPSGPRYYGRGFRAAALPRREDLELEPKERLATALNKATRNTRRGAYHKIHHASDLLKRLDSPTVRSRCPSCDRLFATLDQALP